MRIKLKAQSSTLPGTYELTAIPEGANVPLTFVRLRHEYLKKLVPMIKSRVKSMRIMSDTDGAKEAEEHLTEVERKIELLDKIRNLHDNKKYAEYIEFCMQSA